MGISREGLISVLFDTMGSHSHTIRIISAASECWIGGSSASPFHQGKRLDCGGNLSAHCSESIHSSSGFHCIREPSARAELSTVQSAPSSYPQLRIGAFSGGAAQSGSITSDRFVDHGSRDVFGCLRSSVWGAIGCGENGSSSSAYCRRHRRNRLKGWGCKVSGGSEVGSSEWMSKATPYEVLGVAADSSEEEIKIAFRARIKEYHPDVYQGLGDADAITQRLLQAYELLTGNLERTVLKTRKSLDPFEEPECAAEDLFVNELACIGRGCPYSCVERAPDVFQFASETGCARASNQDSAEGKGGYNVTLAVGQCPQNCIHYVTPEQRFLLEEILQSVLEGSAYSGEVAIMDGLIARAKYENGRYNPPKRKAKKSEQWVDWY